MAAARNLNEVYEDLTETVNKLTGKIGIILEEEKHLNNEIDRLELEQDLLDHWLTHFVEEEDSDGLMEFVAAYLEYRESMNVKDAVENVVEQQELEEDDDDTKD